MTCKPRAVADDLNGAEGSKMQEGADRFVGLMPEYYESGLVPVMFEPYAPG